MFVNHSFHAIKNNKFDIFTVYRLDFLTITSAQELWKCDLLKATIGLVEDGKQSRPKNMTFWMEKPTDLTVSI